MIGFNYLGTHYAGWQVQDNAHSVQAELDKALSTVLRAPISTTGSSRTDTGVHARHSTAHFDYDGTIPVTLLRSLNALLPADIAVNTIYAVPDAFNARFEATHRRYTYVISTRKNPFIKETSWYYPYPMPDIEVLKTCAALLFKYTDYASFCKAHSANYTTLCTIKESTWAWDDTTGLLTFTIQANRFLRGMVRALVATQINVGRGKMTIEQFEELLRNPIPQSADFSAPAEGLTLVEVGYDYSVLQKLPLM